MANFFICLHFDLNLVCFGAGLAAHFLPKFIYVYEMILNFWADKVSK